MRSFDRRYEIAGLPINDIWRLVAANLELVTQHRNLGHLSESREFLTKHDKKRFDAGKAVDCNSVSLISRMQLKKSFTSSQDTFCIAAVVAPRRIESLLGGDAFKLVGNTASELLRIPLVEDLSEQELKRIMGDMDSHSALSGAQKPFGNILAALRTIGTPNVSSIDSLESHLQAKVEITHVGSSMPTSHAKPFSIHDR